MGPLFETGEILGGIVLSWGSTVSVMIYFAWRPRPAKRKVQSLVIPLCLAILCGIIDVLLFGSGENPFIVLFFPLIILAFACLALIACLALPHFISIFFKQTWIVYGVPAVFVFVIPFYLGASNFFEYRKRASERELIKLAARPALAQCCAGSATSCHEVAIAFSKASPLGGYQNMDHELRNKYYAVACRNGSAQDCKEFEYGTGVKFGTQLAPIYDEPCNLKDLDRVGSRPSDEYNAD